MILAVLLSKTFVSYRHVLQCKKLRLQAKIKVAVIVVFAHNLVIYFVILVKLRPTRTLYSPII